MKTLVPISKQHFEQLCQLTGLTPSVVAFALLDVNNVRESSRKSVTRARLSQLETPAPPGQREPN